MISDPTSNIDAAIDSAKDSAVASKMDMAIVMMGTPVEYRVVPVVELCKVIDLVIERAMEHRVSPRAAVILEAASQLKEWQLLFIIDKDGDLAYTWVEGG